jgi:hypothetical protein
VGTVLGTGTVILVPFVLFVLAGVGVVRLFLYGLSGRRALLGLFVLAARNAQRNATREE